MRGWPWASSAAFVSCGTLLRCTKRTGSPALAAHAAAGIAKAGSSAETTSTRSLVLPCAAVWKASRARASANGSRPAMSVVRKPGGRATSPTRMSCAPPAALAPSRRRAASASRLAGGRSGPLESRTAARTGVEARTAPAMPARQSRASISATAAGRFSGVVAGNTARATPAASAMASAPPMRVVFLVAKAGKPRSVVASGSEPLVRQAGAIAGIRARARAAAAPARGDGEGGEQADGGDGGTAHQAPHGTRGGRRVRGSPGRDRTRAAGLHDFSRVG